MTNFREIMRLFSQYSFCLEEDAAIQVISNYTGAHFRFNKDGDLLLGGEFYSSEPIELYNKAVTTIEMREEGGVDIYIDA